MNFEEIFDSVYKINLNLHKDNRGYFYELFNAINFSSLGLTTDFVQDNISFSTSKFTIRGLHYQKKPYEQSKLIYILSGSIYDVFVDVRPNSKNFGKVGSLFLSQPGEAILIPKGFLHGFCTLDNNTLVGYKVDTPYNKESECGVRWNDLELSINWPDNINNPTISSKDKELSSWDVFVKDLEND